MSCSIIACNHCFLLHSMTEPHEYAALTAISTAILENSHHAGKRSYNLVKVKKHVEVTRTFLIVNISAENHLISCALHKSVMHY